MQFRKDAPCVRRERRLRARAGRCAIPRALSSVLRAWHEPAVPLVFVPEIATFLLHGERSILASLAEGATPHTQPLVVPPGLRRRVRGVVLPRERVIERLAQASATELESAPGSFVAYALIARFALDLIAREHVVPLLCRDEDGRDDDGRAEDGHGEDATSIRWGAALAHPRDAERLSALARSLPPAAHAVPIGKGTEAWAPDALVREVLDAVIDAFVREDAPSAFRFDDAPDRRRWETRWVEALTTTARAFDASGFAERTVASELEAWSEPLAARTDAPRLALRLELPESDTSLFRLAFLLEARADRAAQVPADDVWTAGPAVGSLGVAAHDAEHTLLAELGRAARAFAPIDRALSAKAPTFVTLDASEAWALLTTAGAELSESGISVIVPSELTTRGARRLRARVRLGQTGQRGRADGAGLGMLDVVDFAWEAAIGDDTLSARELAALARQKTPLVLHRGKWAVVDPAELAAIRARLAARSHQLPSRVAVAAALGGEAVIDGLHVSVSAGGAFATLVERLRSGETDSIAVPKSLTATLRPYQERGLAWLATMSTLGLGACLADDMGLGKTVQLLSFLLHMRERAPREVRPVLLVAPTSVTLNWEREAARFAPELRIVHHYGQDRAASAKTLARQAKGALVVTTYAILRRDASVLAEVDWAALVLDEAQNVKNASSITARAARAIRAPRRIALTGTPVENRLAELWSLLEVTNPGLLGSSDTFRKTFAVPIERHGDDAAAERLRKIVAPFLLRRTKTDPKVISDLPAKNEMKVICTLTREQASLYKAVLDVEMKKIAAESGMKRRGRVLALLSFLKQITNHPAQYLDQAGPLEGRSGKLARLTEMLDEVVVAGDRALVFTQFREMGDRLVRHLTSSLGREVLFLHGGTPRSAREAMVQRFQDPEQTAPLFVLSLKAGGTGLNLTAASRVFHYDRWWNPAVEDQATDRAFRIGQKRNVQVHKLVTAGTLEEKIDALLDKKRDLARKIVGEGEAWITEMGDRELRELFALSADAVLDDEHDEPSRRTSRASRPEARP